MWLHSVLKSSSTNISNADKVNSGEWVSECTRLEPSTPVRPPQESPKLSPLYSACLQCMSTALDHHHHCKSGMNCSSKSEPFSRAVNKPTCRLMTVAFNLTINPNNGLLQWDVASQRIISSENCQIFASMYSHSASAWSDHTGTTNATGTTFRCSAMAREGEHGE